MKTKSKKETIIPLSPEEYQKLLTHPKWQKKRLEIMQRDNWECKKCKDQETTLHVHHLKYYVGMKPWEYDNKDLVTLCEHCHMEIENIKKFEEVVLFENISIFKHVSFNSQYKRIVIVRYNGKCNILIYDDNNNIAEGIPFRRIDVINAAIVLLKECLKWQDEHKIDISKIM